MDQLQCWNTAEAALQCGDCGTADARVNSEPI